MLSINTNISSLIAQAVGCISMHQIISSPEEVKVLGWKVFLPTGKILKQVQHDKKAGGKLCYQ